MSLKFALLHPIPFYESYKKFFNFWTFVTPTPLRLKSITQLSLGVKNGKV